MDDTALLDPALHGSVDDAVARLNDNRQRGEAALRGIAASRCRIEQLQQQLSDLAAASAAHSAAHSQEMSRLREEEQRLLRANEEASQKLQQEKAMLDEKRAEVEDTKYLRLGLLLLAGVLAGGSRY